VSSWRSGDRGGYSTLPRDCEPETLELQKAEGLAEKVEGLVEEPEEPAE